MRLKGFPRRRRKISSSDKVVSSKISRFAAFSGLVSVGSIEPEHTAHLPLDYIILLSREGQLEQLTDMSIPSRYV